MLTIEMLKEIREVISVKKLCIAVGLQYQSINRKINNDKELTVTESKLMSDYLIKILERIKNE